MTPTYEDVYQEYIKLVNENGEFLQLDKDLLAKVCELDINYEYYKNKNILRDLYEIEKVYVRIVNDFEKDKNCIALLEIELPNEIKIEFYMVNDVKYLKNTINMLIARYLWEIDHPYELSDPIDKYLRDKYDLPRISHD